MNSRGIAAPTFTMNVTSNHEKKFTLIEIFEHGKKIGETIYKNDVHSPLMRRIFNAICKKDISPFHDPYSELNYAIWEVGFKKYAKISQGVKLQSISLREFPYIFEVIK